MFNKNVKNEIFYHIQKANEIAEKNSLGNIFYNEQYLEILISYILGHSYNPGQGPDAYNKNDDPVEYKSINLNSKGKGSFQFHWLSMDKINKYQECKEFYFCLRKGAEIVEIYKIEADKIILELIEKAKEKGTYQTENAKEIGAHKSFSLNYLIKKGASFVYRK